MSQQKQLRVVITGSHGVGKTTLANKIVSDFEHATGIDLVPETARLIASWGYEVNDNISAEGIDVYLNTYEENLSKAKAGLVVSDRCILDLFAYTEHLYLPTGRLGPKIGNEIKEKMISDIKRQDLFIFVPIEFQMTEDDIRPTELKFQLEIEKRIAQILKREQADFFTVSGSVEARFDIVSEELVKRLA